MTRRVLASALAAAGFAAALAATGAARAVTVENLEGLEEQFGRWAPGGDCSRQPRITVERAGMAFEVAGKSEQVTRMEWAVSYGGNAYQGISQWLFPFGSAGSYPILMTFNEGEKRGVLAITPHDQGTPGGPPLGARERALVDGSPYAKCQ
jgi:hypothetical protein